MAEVTIRELRNHGGDVVERVAAGERLVVTRDGRAIAELRPLPQAGLTAVELLRRWSHLPPVDADALRADLHAILADDV